MDKAALQSWLNVLDVWLIVFGVLVAIGTVGASVAGYLHWRRSGDLQVLQTNENLALQKTIELLRNDNLRLQSQVAPRSLSKSQYDELQALKGKVASVSLISQVGVEPSLFSSQITNALMAAGVKVTTYPAQPGSTWTGVFLLFPKPVLDRVNEPLLKAFVAAGLYGGDGTLEHWTLPGIPKDVPLIMIGDKYVSYRDFPYFGPPAAAAPAPDVSEPK